MFTPHNVLLAIAVVCAVGGAFDVGSPRVNLGWLAVACIALALLIT